MADVDTQYDAYETNETDSMETPILYPIIAAVFSTFCMFSIATFIISRRNCCKKKRKDIESVILRQQLVDEQKQMTKCQFKFPLGDHPSFTSIMQQEENEIADEVKQSYKSISLNINKPIICCPQHKMSYTYNPKNIFSMSNHSSNLEETLIDGNHGKKEICGNHKLHKVLPQPVCSTDNNVIIDRNLETIEKGIETKLDLSLCKEQVKADKPINQNNNKLTEIQTKAHKNNLFTSSEIECADNDIKSLYFERWLQQADTDGFNELKSESEFKLDRLDLSYDDIESILTSISRMDSGRMQKLKDTKFYKKLLDNIELPPVEFFDEDTSVESVNLQELDALISNKTGYEERHLSLTHDEIMTALVEDNEFDIVKERDNRSNILKTNNESKAQVKNQNIEINQDKNNHSENFMKIKHDYFAPSESLFKVVGTKNEADTIRSNKKLSDTNSSLKSKIQLSDSTLSSIITESCLDQTNTSYTTNLSRPNTLQLKRKHTELKLESCSDHTKINSRSSKSDSTSSCSSKSSYTTSWQQIYEDNKQSRPTRKGIKNSSENKDENRNIVPILSKKVTRNGNSKAHENKQRQSTKSAKNKNNADSRKKSKVNKFTETLSRSFSFFESKENKIRRIKNTAENNLLDTTSNTSNAAGSRNGNTNLRSTKRKEILWKEQTSSTQSSDANTTMQ